MRVEAARPWNLVIPSEDSMILRLTTLHENDARRAGACPGLADASVGPTICSAAIFMEARNLALETMNLRDSSLRSE